MSSWNREHARSTRSSAMVHDLIPRTPEHDEPAAEVPRWLVRQQQEHVRTAGVVTQPSSSTATPAAAAASVSSAASAGKRKRPVPGELSSDAAGVLRRQRRAARAEKARENQAPPEDDDDLIMVDLLDGAHLRTKTSDDAHGRMSKNSDSIISLPPMDDRLEHWTKLKAEAQDARRMRRASRSIGGAFVPEYMAVHRQARGEDARLPRIEEHDEAAGEARMDHGAGRRNMEPRPVPSQWVAREAMQPPAVKDKSRDPVVNGGHHLASRAGIASTLENTRDPSHFVHSHAQPPRREMPKPLQKKKIRRARGGSFCIKRDMLMNDEVGSGGLSNSTEGASSRERRNHGNSSKRRQRRRHRNDAEDFRPGVWGWRMPAEEDVVMPKGAWIYLPLIGMLTFVLAHSVTNTARFISQRLIVPLGTAIGNRVGGKSAMWAVGMLRGVSLAISFLLVLLIAPQYSAGSGIPEMKCVLSGVLMPRMLNLRTLVAKTAGLAFSLASSISIGRLGPFIHMSGIIAALVSKIPWFSTLHNSARFQLQALSAAMAAGVGATFGAPIGGTLLSIEVMSTYYYVHWLPMALYCSVMGYFLVVSFVQVDKHSFFPVSEKIDLGFASGKRLILYIVLGIICGVAGAALVQFTKSAFIVRRKYFTNATPVRTTMMVAWFALFHTLVASSFGGIMAIPQKSGVGDLFSMNDGDMAWSTTSWRPFDSDGWNSVYSLALSMVIKFLLTGLSLVMPVPAGTFMPIFETGALLGRVFGELCTGFSFMKWVDPKATAIVGAAALTSGTLHTTSVAVVMLELTREAIDVLPLAVGVIVSYGVSKQLCSDLFSEFIKIRRLPFILGLRERYPSENHQFYEDVSTVVAGSFMSTDFAYVTPLSTRGEVFQLLTAARKPWITCAFLSDEHDRRLWGTITQDNLWKALGDGDSSEGESFDEEEGYGSIGRRQSGVSPDEDYIPFLKNFDPVVGSPLVDMGPMQVSYSTPFWKIVTLFRMLSMSTMYVLKDGVTVGCVSKAQVISHSINIEDSARRKRERVRQAQVQRAREEKELLRRLDRDPQTSKRLASRMSSQDIVNMVSAASVGRRSRQNSFSTSRR